MKKGFILAHEAHFNSGGGAAANVAAAVKVPALRGQVPPEQILEWKAGHTAGIFFVANDTDIAYFRMPTRHDVNKAMSKATDTEPFAAVEEFGRLCFIGGSDMILRDDQMFLGAKSELSRYWNGVKTTSGNL